MIKSFAGTPKSPIEIIAARHSLSMAEHPNMYFELAETRRSGCCAWLTTEDVEDNPERKILACDSGETLIDALLNLASLIQAGTVAPELPALIELNNLFTELVEYHSYAYFFLYAKPKEGWVLTISTHHTVGHCQYKQLVSVTTDNLYDTINQGLEEFKAVDFKL